MPPLEAGQQKEGVTPRAGRRMIPRMSHALDAVAREALDAERSRYVESVARLRAGAGPAAVAELERHFARVEEIMSAWAARVRAAATPPAGGAG